MRPRPAAPNALPPPAAAAAAAASPVFAPSPDSSPLYYTAPSSPASPPAFYFTPLSSPPSSPLSSPPVTAPIDDPFPTEDLSIDVALDDDSLTALDKIYLLTTSRTVSHRVFIARALPAFLRLVAPIDAIQYVLPLLSGLAMDQEEQVKEALASELVPLIWWFFSHCQIIPDDALPQDASHSQPACISVQAFTPILGTLLLSPNPAVGTAARYAIVDLLSRLKAADEKELAAGSSSNPDEDATDWAVGLFLRQERDKFRFEILRQIVIGMARLDVDDLPADVSDSDLSQDASLTIVTLASEQMLTLPVDLPGPATSHSSAVLASTLGKIQHSPVNGQVSSVAEMGESHFIIQPEEQFDSENFSLQNQRTNEDGVETELSEQGTVGRISSMSLMAAVTASGSLDDSTKVAFVKEIERVGQDPIYWVRREASFALGALAKVVPEETILCSFLPLFHSLLHDTQWHVRHSALFALPAILTRLPPPQRRSLALDTIVTLSRDESPAVRSGVLEALGEVLHTFYQDDDGPPDKLLQLFLGRKEDKRLRDGQQTPVSEVLIAGSALSSFYEDSERPLICAFNYPAVALTLGRARWPELREVYRNIALNQGYKVQRTLAASLGVLAEIIGKDQALHDLVDVWWGVVRNDDHDVRSKALECVGLFVSVVGPEVGDGIVKGLISAWDDGIFRSWRERESVVNSLPGLLTSTTPWAHLLLVGLLKRALEDAVAAIREAAISALPRFWSQLSHTSEAFVQLRVDLISLSKSPTFRRRMTFLASQLALTTWAYDDLSINTMLDEGFWASLSLLVEDPIIGVRIGLARLVGQLSVRQLSDKHSPMCGDLVGKLSRDPSSEVRSYLRVRSRTVSTGTRCSPAQSDEDYKIRLANLATFSRPPPPPDM